MAGGDQGATTRGAARRADRRQRRPGGGGGAILRPGLLSVAAAHWLDLARVRRYCAGDGHAGTHFVRDLEAILFKYHDLWPLAFGRAVLYFHFLPRFVAAATNLGRKWE